MGRQAHAYHHIAILPSEFGCTIHNGMGYSSLAFCGLFASFAPSGWRKTGCERGRIGSFIRASQKGILLPQATLQLLYIIALLGGWNDSAALDWCASGPTGVMGLGV